MPETIYDLIWGFYRAIIGHFADVDTGHCGDEKARLEWLAKIKKDKELIEQSMICLSAMISSLAAFKGDRTIVEGVTSIHNLLPGYMPAGVVKTCVLWLGYSDDVEGRNSGTEALLDMLNEHGPACPWSRVEVKDSFFPALTIDSVSSSRNAQLAEVQAIPYRFRESEEDWED